MNADLLAAFRRTLYRARFPEGDIDLHVGTPSPVLDAALVALGARRWAWLTAVNPRSELMPEAENRRRMDELAVALAATGWPLFPGVAIDPGGDWPDEPSFLVLGPDAARLNALAEAFEQYAYLEGEPGGPPRLVLLK